MEGVQMKRRPKWGTVVIALGLVAALAMVSPALGGPSLQSLVKKEVSKQLSADIAKKKKSKRGPPGPAGPAGTNGTNGSALGFATLTQSSGTAHVVAAESSPGITSANVTLENSNTVFCFHNLPFTPKMVVGNVDNEFGVGWTVQTAGADADAACNGAEQASVTEVDSGGTPHTPNKVHVAFYEELS
jgi:hypothetical protein